MGRVDEQRLRRLLGEPELGWVLERVRRRIELGQTLGGTIVRRNATGSERDAVAGLFGRPPRTGRDLSVSLNELDALLRRSGAHDGGLGAAVETLTGPVVVRAERTSAEARAWSDAFLGLDAVAARRSELAPWVQRMRASGVVKRLAGGDPAAGRVLLAGVSSVIDALPAGGESLSAFAARVTGRAHALDDSTALGTLALGAARALAGLRPPGPEESPAEARREAWAAVGVLCDELSSTVLTLGLAGDEPVWLTLRQLVRAPVRCPEGRGSCVYVVENPSVVALAADRLRSRCAPVVCTNGQPRAAAMVLLRQLAAAGCRLRHHGDFDWGGLTIGNVLQRRLPIEPWQFDAGAYVRAVAAHPHAARLAGARVVASWDPELADAMVDSGRRIEEELVAGELLDELEASRYF